MTLAETWAELKISLCRAYPALDPIKLLDYPLVDVLDLIKEQLAYNRRHPAEDQAAAETAAPHANQYASKEKVIYRQAGDDWF